MKMLWLSAITATCLLLGNMANAGDRHHWDDHREARDRRCDDDHWRRGNGWGRPVYYRPVQYRPAEVYYRPVYYRPAPVYREPVRYRDGVHGSITVGF